MTISKILTLGAITIVISSFQFPQEAQARRDECSPQSLTVHSQDEDDDDYHWPTATSICGNDKYSVDPRTGRKVQRSRHDMNHD